MLPKSVKEYLASHRQKHLEELLALLRFPSVSSQSAHEADCLACVKHVAGHLRRLGFEAQLRPWRKHPVLIARCGPGISPDSAPTVLIYGHYDVQPPEPLELWASDPFEPAIREGAVYARGASDDKGQFFTYLKAAEAFIKTQGRLPVRVIFFIEGEEEIGSPELEEFVTANAADLQADCAIVSDSDFFTPQLPAITYGLRGLVYLELTVTGPGEDLHSGTHGGAVVNTINALSRIVAGLHDDAGRVTLPGYYDDVVSLTDQERQAWQALPFDRAGYAAKLGAELVGGEAGVDVLERRWARPTLDCNGISGGYTGQGVKTILPAWAKAKLSMRLVPHQRPEKVVESFRQYLAGQTPAGVKVAVDVLAKARPVIVPLDSPAIRAAKDALREAFGVPVAMVRDGASVPVTELMQRVLGVEPVMVGLGLPDDNHHAPNERFSLEQFYSGIVASAALLQNLAATK